jgi:hypothetical protein
MSLSHMIRAVEEYTFVLSVVMAVYSLTGVILLELEKPQLNVTIEFLRPIYCLYNIVSGLKKIFQSVTARFTRTSTRLDLLEQRIVKLEDENGWLRSTLEEHLSFHPSIKQEQASPKGERGSFRRQEEIPHPKKQHARESGGKARATRETYLCLERLWI